MRIRSGMLAMSLAIATTVLACGGGSGPTAPSGGSGGSGGPGGSGGGATSSATITIGSNGAVSPSTVTIARGGQVTFVNNDSRNHEMSSDPHPSHEDCPALEQVGFLSPGQSRTSGAFNTARTCGFHDHNNPTAGGLLGRIIVQ